MTIVDLRLRPPTAGSRNTFLYNDLAAQRRRSEVRGMTAATALVSQTVEETLREMDAAGVTVGVVPARMGSEHLGVITNAEVERLVTENTGRFIGMASPDPSALDSAADELGTLLKRPAFAGVNLEPGTWPAPLYVDDRRLFPIYECCQSMDAAVMIMAGGNAGPDPSYTSPVPLDHVLANFPKLKVIAAHGGWPWVHHILHLGYRRANLHISPDSYIYGMAGWRDYVDAGNGYMQDRMFFGTSYPILPLGQCVEQFRGLFKPEVLPKLFGANAVRVLKIGG